MFGSLASRVPCRTGGGGDDQMKAESVGYGLICRWARRDTMFKV